MTKMSQQKMTEMSQWKKHPHDMFSLHDLASSSTQSNMHGWVLSWFQCW